MRIGKFPRLRGQLIGIWDFLFYNKNGMPLVAMHWQHRFNHMVGDSEVKELLLAYEKARNEEETRYGNFLNMQGLKDCYKLIKILEMN